MAALRFPLFVPSFRSFHAESRLGSLVLPLTAFALATAGIAATAQAPASAATSAGTASVAAAQSISAAAADAVVTQPIAAQAVTLPDAPLPNPALLPATADPVQESGYSSSSTARVEPEAFDARRFDFAGISNGPANNDTPNAAWKFDSGGPGAASRKGQNGDHRVPLNQCPYDETRARECRVHWRDLMLDSTAYLAFQDIGNLYTGYWYRYETTHGKWFDRWINSAAGWRWNQWNDGNPFLDDYVGHSMMGSITNYIWIENDPKGMTLLPSNSREYWHSRVRAFVYSTAFSFQWKLGPFGEAGIGHNGDHYFYENNGDTQATNETGWVELVTTPVGGFLWTLAEDRIDQHLVTKLEDHSRNPLMLVLYSFLTPSRAAANIFRFRPMWYRDTRTVHATPLFHHQLTTEEQEEFIAAAPASDSPVSTGNAPAPATNTKPAGSDETVAVDTSASTRPVPAVRSRPVGGYREIGAYIGVSLKHDTTFGSDEDTRYMDIIVRGSALLHQSRHTALRFAPEIIALSMLDEPNPGETNFEMYRRRTYGTGLSPEGLQFVFAPMRRVQPFVDEHAGFIYYFKPVLTPNGTQLVYDASFGGGINFLRRPDQALTVGYRLQHLGPMSGPQNYGTDAHTFYFAVSHFFMRRPAGTM